jgi:hypothetical protein
MSDQQCEVCHEFLISCHDFRLYNSSCNYKVYTCEERTLLRYKFVILQASRAARMYSARIVSKRRALINTLCETSPVIKPLVNIIAEYL